MQYAIIDNKRVEAFPEGRGRCPQCNSPMIARCGNRNIHHWAHDRSENCDPWWENETEWHRNWKNLFPIECREVSHTDEITGEIHRADIKTKTGIVVELQHSSLNDQERISRELFYKNMIWIIDGKPFENNFDIYHMLPDPASEIAQDLIWIKTKKSLNGTQSGLFYRFSEEKEQNPEIEKYKIEYGLVHYFEEIKNEVNKNCNGYHQYDWIRPRKAWLESTKPVYIDFGNELLYQLLIYDESGLKCIRKVAKKKIIHDLMVEVECEKLATRFYKIN